VRVGSRRTPAQSERNRALNTRGATGSREIRASQQRQRQVKGVRMHNMIRRLYRRPRIVGASLTSAAPGPGESAGGGRRTAERAGCAWVADGVRRLPGRSAGDDQLDRGCGVRSDRRTARDGRRELQPGRRLREQPLRQSRGSRRERAVGNLRVSGRSRCLRRGEDR
jgi:hypothetical protein